MSRPDDWDPIEHVQKEYGLSDDEMLELFGTDRETQQRMLRERPYLHRAVRELDSLMSG